MSRSRRPARVTVNDRDVFGVCWVCGDPMDHDGVPHGTATGDGLTRRRIVALMGDRQWRPLPKKRRRKAARG